MEADGIRLPVYGCNALVLGSGAAGWRAAVELKRHGIDVVVATQNLYGARRRARDRRHLLHDPPCPDGNRLTDIPALASLGERKIEVSAKCCPPCRRRTIGVDDLHPVRQILSAQACSGRLDPLVLFSLWMR